MAAKAACREAKHRLPDCQHRSSSNRRPGGDHDAGTVAAGGAGVAGVHAQHVEHIPAWTQAVPMSQRALHTHPAGGTHPPNLISSNGSKSWLRSQLSKVMQAAYLQVHHADLKFRPTALTATTTCPGFTVDTSTACGARLLREPRGLGSSWNGCGRLLAVDSAMAGR